MESEQILGFGLMLIGAVCGGSFGLPSKYAKEGTPWEVLWGPFFFFVAVLIPVLIAPLVVQDLGGIYAGVGMGTIIAVLVYGFLWGLGSMTLGMSFAFIGLSLAYALNYGAQIVFGSMMPMALFSADEILTPHGYVILSGVAVCLAGVVVCGRAGILKERSRTKEPDKSSAVTDGKQPKMLVGLIIGVVSGILCACYAVASAYAGPVGAAAAEAGNAPWAAAWAVTALILWGGAVSSCLYCAVQLTRNKTWGYLCQAGAGRILLLGGNHGRAARRGDLLLWPGLDQPGRLGNFGGLSRFHVLRHHRRQHTWFPDRRMERRQPPERCLDRRWHLHSDHRRLLAGTRKSHDAGLVKSFEMPFGEMSLRESSDGSQSRFPNDILTTPE